MSRPNDPTRREPVEEEARLRPVAPFGVHSFAAEVGDLPIGTLPRFFGDYELLEELGWGGMGIVYKARHLTLDRVVALKMIRDGRLAQGHTVERFYQEARAAAALDHPGIVPIYEVGQHNGQHYFTMALVQGTNLDAAVRQEGLPTPEAAALLVAAVADAVEYAHRHGVIHRDLKPENILLEGGLGGSAGPGRPRVTDFGLAKHIEKTSGLTAPGEVMGTPRYLAPEQARGDHRAIGPGTDVHGLGAILYFLLTGNPPFTGPGFIVLYQVVEEAPPSPSQLEPGVPKGLEAICLKCLEKAPERRYATAGEVAEALRAWARLGDQAPAATAQAPGERRGPRRALVAAGAAALVVAVGFGLAALWMWSPREQRADGESGRGEVPVKVKGHETLFRDFALKVQMSGRSVDRTGVRRLSAGEKATFRIEVERDAYVGIWNVAPDRTITQLFPNEAELDHLFRAGQPRTVPRDVDLVAVPSGGQEQVWVVASTERWELPEGRRKGPYLIFETAEEQRKWEQTMERGFELRKRERMAVAEFVLSYQVSPHK